MKLDKIIKQGISKVIVPKHSIIINLLENCERYFFNIQLDNGYDSELIEYIYEQINNYEEVNVRELLYLATSFMTNEDLKYLFDIELSVKEEPKVCKEEVETETVNLKADEKIVISYSLDLYLSTLKESAEVIICNEYVDVDTLLETAEEMSKVKKVLGKIN